MRHRVVPDAEAARARGCHRGADRVKERHTAEHQQDDLQQRQTGVDRIQRKRRIAHVRGHLGHRRSRAFRAHQIDGLAARKRQNDQHEYQHTHAADPVGQAAPEQRGMRKRLNVGYDGRARGGKARNGLEQRVYDRGDLTAEQEGQRARNAEQNPAQRNGDKALARVKPGVFRLFAAEYRSNRHT